MVTKASDVDFKLFLKCFEDAKSAYLDGTAFRKLGDDYKETDSYHWMNFIDLVIAFYNGSTKKKLESFYENVDQVDEIINVLKDLGRDIGAEIYDIITECNKRSGDNDE